MVIGKRKKPTGRKPTLAFSKSYDNGEVLKSRITRSMQYVVQSFSADVSFEEYVVPDAPVSVQAPVNAQTPVPEQSGAGSQANRPPAPSTSGGGPAPQPTLESALQNTAPLPPSTPPPSRLTGDAAKLEMLDKIKNGSPLADAARPATAARSAAGAQPSAGAAPSQSASISRQSDFDRFHADPNPKNNTVEEDDFVKDMQAIMRGEKLYNKDAKTIESRGQKPPEPAMPNTLSQMENKQAIFDQIAESMTYAKAYDLGNIDLDKRFNDFDKSAEKREAFYRSASMGNKAPVENRPASYPPVGTPPPVGATNSAGVVSAVSSEDFLVDLNSIARVKEMGHVVPGPIFPGQVFPGQVLQGQVIPGQTKQTQVGRKKEYLFEQAGMTFSKASGYSYMQNPAMIAGIAVSDAIQIGLGAVSVAQAGVSSMAGSFSLTFDKAQRLLTNEARAQMPGSQTSKLIFREEVLWVGEQKPGFANATIVMEWEGNAYGEIGTAVISRDLDKSTDWTQSACNISFTRLEKIPQPGTDPRTWPIVYRYEGTYNPLFNGKYEFEGEIEINAFGGLLHTRHHVVDRSALEFVKIGEPEEYVVQRPSVLKQIPQIPAEQIAYLKTKLP